MSRKKELLSHLLYGGYLTAKDFKALLDASYESVNNAPEHISDFVLDKQLSSADVKTYFNQKSHQVVVAYKGTQGALDWSNNLIYALTGVKGYTYTPRYQHAKKMHEEVVKKYGKSKITSIGHSQGAILARELGNDGYEVITLNPASRGEYKGNNIYDVKSSLDVVSSMSDINPFSRSHTTIIPAMSKNPLTEHKKNILNRLDPNLKIGRKL